MNLRRSILLLASLTLALSLIALAQEVRRADGSIVPKADLEHTAWIDSVLRAAQTIKPGMTRADLLKLFDTEGGIYTRSRRQYVYRECPYIKVDIDFEPVGPEEALGESSRDKIVKISRPYLEWTHAD